MSKRKNKPKSKANPTVIDFFCGAGGFSEGFRQEGFNVIMGVDHWKPAIDTFNYNFGKQLQPQNILDISNSIQAIEELPDTDVIIGSPPCVSFSNSNKSGKGDKSLGVKLTEAFLRIVAIKKHKKNSKLKAWLMENVSNSRRYLQPTYTFHDLKLSDWAKKNRLSPYKIAIVLLDNSAIINSAEYGSCQVRKRVISGEILKFGRLIIPKTTHKDPDADASLPAYKTLSLLKTGFPAPFEKPVNDLVKDPIYGFQIERANLTDHFYDSGVYQCDWKNSEYLKTSHPYMGKMSFPENIHKPSRTITATNIANSRESILYRSEIDRVGDGEYRSPTVREAAMIMGFPLTYQFVGAESAKLRLVGNAVCPSVSSAFAKEIRIAMGLPILKEKIINKAVELKEIPNLNTFSLKMFDKPPVKKRGAKFRRHPFKEGNMTIALSNYDVSKSTKRAGKWRVFAFYGTGEGFGISKYTENYYIKLESEINDSKSGKEFIKIVNNGFSEKIASSKLLQKMYEDRRSTNGYLDPTTLLDEVANIVNRFVKKGETFEQKKNRIFKRKIVPKRHLYALYAINKIITTANNRN